MKLRNKIIVLLFFALSPLLFGQMKDFKYKREIKGITQQWHQLELPNAIFSKCASNLEDVKIFGITAKDTIETPFSLNMSSNKMTITNFSELNGQGGYYFIFETPSNYLLIDEINLSFSDSDFDWLVNLEGSDDLKNWNKLLNNYRIISIKNAGTDFNYTTLNFKRSKYRYYRIFIKTYDNKPELNDVTITNTGANRIQEKDIVPKKIKIDKNKKDKNTYITVDLDKPMPLSQIKLKVSDTYDYFRPVYVEQAIDSTETRNGWEYIYERVEENVLSSDKSNLFKINTAPIQHLRVIIDNQDNQPLNIDKIELKQYVHSLIVRFTEPAQYYLVYGNKDAYASNYDIQHFLSKVPEQLPELSLGQEMLIHPKKISQKKTETSFLNNKVVLWVIMGIIIFTLGWLTIAMMIKKKE